MVDRILAGQTAARFRRRRAANPDPGDRHRYDERFDHPGLERKRRRDGYNVYRDDGRVQSTIATSSPMAARPATTHSYFGVRARCGGRKRPLRRGQRQTASTEPYSQKVSASGSGTTSPGGSPSRSILQLGQEYGYLASFTLYLCGSTWTNSPTCGPLALTFPLFFSRKPRS